MADWLGVSGAMAALAQRSHVVAHGAAGATTAPEFVLRVAAWQRAFATAPGRAWALYLESTTEFAAALFGAWHAGKHVVLPGDTRAETLAALHARTDGYAGDLPGGLWPQTPGEAIHRVDWPALPLRDTLVTMFTSGSTGAPGAIVKHLSQLDAEVRALQAAFGASLPAQTRVLATVSHQHIYGLLFCVLWPLAAARAMPSDRLAFHEEIRRACGDAPALLVTSPAHLRRMPPALDWSAARGGLQAVFSSGGPLPAEAASDALRHLGRAPIEVFGSSETGGIAWRQRARHDDRWTSLPGVQWRLQDGLLAVRSAHLPDDGWYLCADRVQPAGEGGFTLAGRADRIVKIEEKRVSLTQVEQTLSASPLVQEARVVLLELDVGTRLGAVVVPSASGAAILAGKGRAALLAALRECLAQAVHAVALPRRWSFAETLPCNTQGKTTEAMLRDVFRRVLPTVRWEPAVDALAASAELEVGEDLAVFDGHFPGTPIVPGVAQLDWIMALAPERLPVPPRVRFRRLEALKFQAVIVPGTTVRMALTWQPERSVLAFRLSSAGGPHASGRFVFGETDV
ncbi:AMP-binding protein [Cupriavidus basilensis]|uniref:AMP-binding protein n=1 Tax=Cupriavidus basilensis TaxID=68895 RepID=UPI0023E8F270|nr:AMP-binding protein [Cupriavidus basilensis]MDF3888453.1 AMP-binding protein [Cupriavidus basilensis]